MNNRNVIRFLTHLTCLSVVLVPIGISAKAASSQQPTIAVESQQQTSTSEADALLQTAAALYRSGKLDDALANCVKAAALNQNDFRPHVLAGLVYMAQMKMKSASESFAKALRLRPAEKEIYLLKASADSRRNAIDEALAACRKALEIDPNFAEAYAMIGETLKDNEKRRAEAIAAYETALRINPQLVSLYEPLGSTFVDAKDEKRAEEVFRQGIAADPKHMSGRFQLGRLLVEQGRLVEARELWDGRTSDEDRITPSFITLLARAENLKRATDALAKTPDDPDALITMGIAVMDGDSWVIDGRQERAIVYFRKALSLKPNYAKAQYHIVKAMIEYADTFEKNSKKVTQELAKLRQLDPQLAKEMEGYRKTYQTGIIGTPLKVDQ